MRNLSFPKYLIGICVFSVILFTSCIHRDSEHEVVNHTSLPEIKDSVSVKCLGDMDVEEEVDTVFVEDGMLTCKLGKYENCAFSELDTFYFTNDTLDLRLTSADGERLACDCYLGIYARFQYPFKKPRALTVNGHVIGSDHGIVIAKEDE